MSSSESLAALLALRRSPLHQLQGPLFNKSKEKYTVKPLKNYLRTEQFPSLEVLLYLSGRGIERDCTSDSVDVVYDIAPAAQNQSLRSRCSAG